MIVTEQEARTKVCPFISERHPKQGRMLCLSSQCMAWRWMPRHSPEEIAERKTYPHIPDTNAVVPKGYCKA